MSHFCRLMSIALAIGLAGCGSGSGSSGGSGSPGGPPAPPPALLGITIQPGDSTLDLDGTLLLNVTGTWSDGSVLPVNAAWSVSDPSITSLSQAGPSAITMATGLDRGTADVTAAFQGQVDTVVLTVASIIPADPGQVYAMAVATFGGKYVARYPAVGGGAPDGVTGGSFSDGFVMNAAADALFMTVLDTGSKQGIDRYDLLSGITERVADLPDYGPSYFGLDYDSDGLLYTISPGYGLVRADPATGETETLGDTGGVLSLAVRPDGIVVSQPLLQGAALLLFGFDVAAGTEIVWTYIPVTAPSGYIINGGVACDRFGVAYVTDYFGAGIYRCEDLDGDGNALDAGEASRFGNLPTGHGEFDPWPMICGLAVGRGDGSLLVNSGSSATAASPGLYWMTDRNRNGNCDDLGEVTLFNPVPVVNDRQGNCIQAKR